MTRFWLPAGLLACGLILSGLSGAQAHSHVRIIARSELIYAPDGALTGVRHAWTFDEAFTAYALQDVEPKTKGVYTREDLAPLAQANAEGLKDFGFFTFATADGKKQRFDDPADYYLEYKDAALTLHFSLPLRMPVKAKELVVELVDPTGFNDFRFADRDAARLVGAPAACRLALQRPTEEADDKPDEEASDSGRRTNDGVKFANKIAVTCP